MSGNLNEFGITHLRHVDLAVPDFETQRTFYKDTWGLTEQGKDGNLSYFAAEGSPEQYVVRLREADEKRLDLISFGADSAAYVDALAAKLGSEGVQVVAEPGTLQTAGGGYGFRFFDLDGRTIEISSDVDVAPAPQDRGGRVDPRPHLARGDQLQRPERHPRLVHEAPRLPALRLLCSRTWAR